MGAPEGAHRATLFGVEKQMIPGLIVKYVIGEDFVRWLGSFAETNGVTSSKKVAVLMGASALSLGVFTLLVAKAKWVLANGGDCSLEIAAASIPLCALAGVAYTMGKPAERPGAPQPAAPKEE